MRKVLQFILLGLILLLVCLASALLAMRFAIHGREARVPRLEGMTPAEAERAANAAGLVLTVERRFYSPRMAAGRVVSQMPPPDTEVRRGWKVRVAESLGPQRAAIPNVVGQSEHAAEINISRRGLEIGSTALIHMPGAQPGVVLAQNPAPDAQNAVWPKIGLIVAAQDTNSEYVMPRLIGRSKEEAKSMLEKAGLELNRVDELSSPQIGPGDTGVVAPAGTVLRQFPLPGHRVAAGASVNVVVSK